MCKRITCVGLKLDYPGIVVAVHSNDFRYSIILYPCLLECVDQTPRKQIKRSSFAQNIRIISI